MQKYPLLSGRLKLEGFGDDALWVSPNAMSTDRILTCHTEAYWRKLQEGSWTRREEKRSGFTWSPELIRREAIIMQGSWECAQSAAQGGVGLNIAGGTHHAFSDRAEGFCLLNDLALSANLLLNLVHVNRVLVVDLDVHQGNGTASITAGDPRIFSFSMHGASNYPFHNVNGISPTLSTETWTNPETFSLPSNSGSAPGVPMGTITLNTPGTYNYDCSIGSHAAQGMVGTIIVEAAASTVDVTFNVNMANEPTSPDGVFLAGGVDFGVAGDNPMSDAKQQKVTHGG